MSYEVDVEDERDRERAAIEQRRAAHLEQRRLHWMWFFCGLAGIAAVTIVIVVSLGLIKANHARDMEVRRARIEACGTVENETARVFCITRGW